MKKNYLRLKFSLSSSLSRNLPLLLLISTLSTDPLPSPPQLLRIPSLLLYRPLEPLEVSPQPSLSDHNRRSHLLLWRSAPYLSYWEESEAMNGFFGVGVTIFNHSCNSQKSFYISLIGVIKNLKFLTLKFFFCSIHNFINF